MSKVRNFTLTLFVLLCLFPAVGLAQAADIPSVEITGAWVRPTVAVDADVNAIPAPTTAIYMNITNPGDEDIQLIGARYGDAVVEIHESAMSDEGMMRMTPLPDGVRVPAGETVLLEPGGFHLMVIGPPPLATPDAIVTTLRFTTLNEEDLRVEWDVRFGVPVLEEPPQRVEGMSIDVTTAWLWTLSESVVGDEDLNPVSGPLALYFEVTNTGDADRMLLSGASVIANVVEVARFDADLTGYEGVSGGVIVLAGETARLRPGGTALVLTDVEAFPVGGAVSVSVAFSDRVDGERTVVFAAVVEDRTDAGGGR